jgi:hypothetical protein
MTQIRKRWTYFATAALLLLALWSVIYSPFVNLPGMGAETYDSFGKLSSRFLVVTLALGAVFAILCLRRLAILLTGISLGLLAATLSTFWQQIDNLKTEAAEASDVESQEMIRTMLAETHPSAGFWIISMALLAAAIIIALIPFPEKEKRSAPGRE